MTADDCSDLRFDENGDLVLVDGVEDLQHRIVARLLRRRPPFEVVDLSGLSPATQRALIGCYAEQYRRQS